MSLPVRPRRVRAGASALLLAGLATVLAACGSTSVASAVRVNALSVDGTAISRKSFEHDISALASNAKLKALDKSVSAQGSTSQSLFDSSGHATRVLTTRWMNRLVNQIVVDRAFKSMHLKISATDVTEGKAQFAQLFASGSDDGSAIVKAFPTWFQTQEDGREARLVSLTAVLDAKHPVTQAQMLDYYNKNVGSLCPAGFNVAHILVNTLAEAQAIETQLAGGADFATLAKTKSIDTGSAKNGGSLGCLANGEFVTVFQNAAEAAKVGVPTAPVHSQFGYHIILKTKYVPPTFASLQTQLRQQVLQTLDLTQKFVAAALKKATVHIDAAYGTWNKKTFHIDAPKVPSVRNSRTTTSTTPTPTT